MDTSDNNNMKPPPSPGSTDTEEFETWTVVGSGRKLKENLSGESSPKITISKDTESGEESDHQNKDDEVCQECVKNEKLLQTPQRKRNNSSDSRSVINIVNNSTDFKLLD